MRLGVLVRRALVFSLITLASSGCTYATNRLKDFADTFGLGGGVGIGSNVRVTHYLQSSSIFPHLTGPGFRLLGRRIQAPTGPAGEWGLAPIYYFRGARVEGKDRSMVLVLARTLPDAKNEKAWQEWYNSKLWSFLPDRKSYEENYDRRLWDIGISLYLGLGLDLDFNPYELADFFLGFFGVDFAEDDEPEEAEKAAPAT